MPENMSRRGAHRSRDHTPAVSYKNHRFSPDIIAHAVWLYYRFPLSLRLVEEMLLERGIVVSYETIRRWAGSLVPAMCADCAANGLRGMISGIWMKS
jgi:hypothetical protein